MSKDEELVPMGDLPAPALEVLEQRELPLAAVPVDVQGPVQTQFQPARTGTADTYDLGTVAVLVLSADPRRNRAVLVCDTAWNFKFGKSGGLCPWPPNVPLTLLSTVELWATGTAGKVLTVVTDIYAQ